jgi:hypothetical protein
MIYLRSMKKTASLSLVALGCAFSGSLAVFTSKSHPIELRRSRDSLYIAANCACIQVFQQLKNFFKLNINLYKLLVVLPRCGVVSDVTVVELNNFSCFMEVETLRLIDDGLDREAFAFQPAAESQVGTRNDGVVSGYQELELR